MDAPAATPAPETPPSGTGAPVTPAADAPVSYPAGQEWKAQIPENLRQEKVWESVNDLPTLAKRFVDGHKYNVGALRLPPAGARPEAWDEVYNKLGRPASAAEYTVQPPIMPEGVPWDEGNQKGFQEEAHKLGLSNAQVQGVLNYYGDFIAKGYEGLQQQTKQNYEQSSQALEAEYGPTTFQRHLATVQAFIDAEGNPALKQELVSTGWGNHPELSKLLIKVANEWKGDQIAKGMKEEDFTNMPSPQAAHDEAQTIMADMAGPYWNKSHGLHNETRAKVSRLLEIAHPNQIRGNGAQ